MTSRGGAFTRGFRPRYEGVLRQVGEVKGPRVTDESGNTFLTKFVQPVKEATADTGPVRIEQRGAVQTRTRQARILQPFADGLKNGICYLQGRKCPVHGVVKVLRELSTPAAFRSAVTEGSFNRSSIVQRIVTLFPDMFKIERRDNALYVASVVPRPEGPASSNLNFD